MLSKTNNEDPNQSREISNVGKSFKGQYDKMVEDFEDLIEKRKVDGNHTEMSQSQLNQEHSQNHPRGSKSQQVYKYPQNRGIISQSQSGRIPTRENQYSRGRQETNYNNGYKGDQDHAEEIEAYNRIIQEQLNQNKNTGQRVTYADQNQGHVQMETNYDSDLNKYFDTEINDILNKIKRCKVEGVNDCDVNLGNKYKLMNCTNSLKKGQLEQMQLDERRYTEKANQMFENKNIEDLKNRLKTSTMVDGEVSNHPRSKTFHNKLQEDTYLKNLVKPEINRAGEFEGEIELLKRKTILETTTPKMSIEGELLSKANDGETGRRSQQSNNFSFNPKTAKQNMNHQMNNLIDEMDLEPVKKNITVSMVIDDLEQKNLKDLQDLRNKANTMQHESKKIKSKIND